MSGHSASRDSSRSVVDIRGRLPTRHDDLADFVPFPEIEEASNRVLANWVAGGTRGVAESRLASELAVLSSAAHAALNGDESRLAVLKASPLRQKLLEDLRGELVRHWVRENEQKSRRRSIRVLKTLEDIRKALGSRSSANTVPNAAGIDSLELISEVAHDLRSPLTSILTLAETLRRGHSGDVNETQRRQLGLIYSAALALSTTASDVMELAHGGDPLCEEPAPMSVSEVFQSVHDIVQPMAEEKRLEIRLRPPANDQRLGHVLALSRVLLNLTANALKFTSNGFVEVAAEPRGPLRLEFSVRDTGPGIPANALLKLFQPFRREPGRPGYYFSGTGLGLVICQKLVAAMGSELQVETRSGWGTRFYFEAEIPPVDDSI
ncbi:MAG: hypothetical protein GWN53_11205 [Gammaproteobacteria bacterium]|uniref:histidine kinase n=1 Tax=Candidatus Kutchimonas denitrificans TaxID=3056748 RepID=A0AAE5CB03_9BACT|nr:HAMP domain-containing histidine kinase [Gemmatimonadota bacterium]NIR75152.1 HAMP domain-containing histidine kinase [Candidatus Kutchimonas denitrificans]NIU52962.1 hypothetical protein [Gemmatimonadota bacterium]NIV52431.1 hypothetical protein [Gammaproteobacteria bacterium]NIY44851.1 hypothetical protein [Gemmatimonadota bacterium]